MLPTFAEQHQNCQSQEAVLQEQWGGQLWAVHYPPAATLRLEGLPTNRLQAA